MLSIKLRAGKFMFNDKSSEFSGLKKAKIGTYWAENFVFLTPLKSMIFNNYKKN